MIDRQRVFEIHQLRQQGIAVRKIARMLQLNRETVIKYLDDPLPRTATCRRQSKLDPFKEQIRQMLEAEPGVSAVVIGQRLGPMGYAGGITILRNYLRSLGRRVARTAFVRIESAPGEQMQIDWGHFGSLSYGDHQRKLYALVVTESHSRMLFVQFTHSQNQDCLHQGLLKAFVFLGGCPKQLLFDNMPTAVVERQGRLIRFNDRFLDFLIALKITPKACNVRKPEEKGKVERAIGYLRKNFWPLRTFTDLGDVNGQVLTWLDTLANQRIHQGTGERPCDRFERLALQELPDPLPDCRETISALVYKDFVVRFDANTYSVPPWTIGRHLTLKADQETICLYDRHKLIVTHPRCWQRKQRIELPAHRELVKKIQHSLWRDRQIAFFASLGPAARDYLNALGQAALPIRANIQRLLRLCDQYGSAPLLWAIEKALAHRAFGADYVQNILHQHMAPVRRHEPVSLKRQPLNEIRLPRPCLAEYDSLVLKRRPRNE
jgi:transposase